jgi:hypothetical protein
MICPKKKHHQSKNDFDLTFHSMCEGACAYPQEVDIFSREDSKRASILTRQSMPAPRSEPFLFVLLP